MKISVDCFRAYPNSAMLENGCKDIELSRFVMVLGVPVWMDQIFSEKPKKPNNRWVLRGLR
jgi:hypothetical protein